MADQQERPIRYCEFCAVSENEKALAWSDYWNAWTCDACADEECDE